ncbi:MAG: hypothetical protein COB46_07020 [Rhodospirillaceae bacterium]|nr:MAG: hypothetical protein COB46_07020 [Rhodospirillaceae bacterium]
MLISYSKVMQKLLRLGTVFVLVAYGWTSFVPQALAVQGGNPEKYDTTGLTFNAGENNFCWRNSYTTGPGVTPTCSPGEERVGLFCRNKCPSGTKRNSVFKGKCMPTCPSNMTDKGATCLLTKTKYPNDKNIFKKKDFAACEKWHGAGKCVLNGASKYVKKCDAGFKAVGKQCKLEDKPDCTASGLTTGPGNNCKKVASASPIKGGKKCKSGQEKSLGRCYDKCNSSDTRLGITCWKERPPTWVRCGMGFARNKKSCASVVMDQAMSVGTVAANIATLGATSGVDKAVDGAKKVEKVPLSDWKKMKNGWETFSKTKKFKAGKAAYVAQGAVFTSLESYETNENALTDMDKVRAAAQLMSIIDISGVSGVVSAFSYPACLKYYGDGANPDAFLFAGYEMMDTSAMSKKIALPYVYKFNTVSLRSKAGNKCVAGTGDKKGAHNWVCEKGNKNQQFEIIRVEDEWVRLKNVLSGKCLEIHNPKTKNGTVISQGKCNKKTSKAHYNQMWRVEDKGNKSYQIQSRVKKQKCLDLKGANSANGTLYQQWDCKGVAAQLFEIKREN